MNSKHGPWPADDARQHARERPHAESRGHARGMKSPNDKARAERVVATLTRLRSVSDVFTVERELATLARGDARHERTDQGSERHDAFIAIQALRKGLATASRLASSAASADDQILWQDAISKASTAASADVQTLWHDAIAKAQVWLSSFN